MRLIPTSALAALVFATSGCASIGAMIGGGTGQMVGEVLDFAFKLASPHLKAVVGKMGLDPDVATAVNGLIDGKGATETAMTLVRAKVPGELASVLDSIAGGESVEAALAGERGLRAVTSAAPETATRWKDFSGHVREVESSIEALVSAFNTGEMEAVMPHIGFPYYEDDKYYPNQSALLAALADTVAQVKEANLALYAEITPREHMPSEAFALASQIGGIEVDEAARTWAASALGGGTGFVTLVNVTVGVRMTDQSHSDVELFVSKKIGGSYKLVGSATVGEASEPSAPSGGGWQ